MGYATIMGSKVGNEGENGIPTTHKEFEQWRKKQTFATPELDTLARLVGNDQRILEGPAGRVTALQDSAAKLRAEFEAKLAAHR